MTKRWIITVMLGVICAHGCPHARRRRISQEPPKIRVDRKRHGFVDAAANPSCPSA